MKSNRLEAFSDGVLAIIITIMVLELKVPHGETFDELLPLVPVFFSYVLSFIYIGIYWNNHHHLMHTVTKVNGSILWANLHLLFWLSLIPFVTGWMGENNFGSLPMAFYGGVLLLSAIAYFILQRQIKKTEGANSILSKAMGNGRKEKLSLAFYILAIAISFVNPWLAGIIYVIVASLWIIPDKRIERIFKD